MTPARALTAWLCCLLLPATPAAAEGPALWHVAGRTNDVYLFGSVHLLKPGEFRIDGPLGQAYADAEVLYLEIDVDDLSPLDIATTTAARAMDPEGRSLDELMGPEAGLAQERATAAGIDLALLANMEPWFAGLAVVTLALAREGYTAGDGVEQRVQERAAEDGKEILGLETLDEQLAALDGLELPLQREFLLKSLEDAARPQEALAAFLRAWKDGDVESLARELEEEFATAPQLYRSLVVERNRHWLARILDLLDDERDYLVVVGVLHLVGPDGLPAMLEASGFEPARR